jgi:integrase
MNQFFSIVTVRHQDGERLPILLDANRQPITWANEYILYVRRTRVASSTLKKELRALGYLYAWGQQHHIDVMERMRSGNGLSIDEITMQLFPWLRKNFQEEDAVRPLVVARDTVDFRMNFIRSFMRYQLQSVISRLSASDPRIDRIQAKIKAMEDGCKSLASSVGRGARKRKEGLTAAQVERLLSVCHPDSPENPWQRGCRERNYLILLILLTFALRRGELLKLYVGDCQLAGSAPVLHVQRRPDDPNDPRRDEPAVKTQSRVLPCDSFLARRLHAYIVNERIKIPHARKSPFLILREDGQPLSLPRVNGILAQIVARFPEFKGLSPHILRHTCDTRITEKARELGIEEASLTKHLKYFNGWLGDNSETYTRLAARQEAS